MSGRALGECCLTAADERPFLENFIHAAGIDVETGGDPVLEFAIPVTQPDFDGIIEGELAARHFIIVHLNDPFISNGCPLETETGKCDSECANGSDIGMLSRPSNGFGLVR